MKRIAALGMALACLWLAARAEGPSRDWTPVQWQAWRDGQIAAILKPDKDGYLDREDVQTRAQIAYEAMRPFEQKLAQDKQLKNFLNFTRAQGLMASPEHALGFPIDDREYARRTAPFVELPSILRSQAFLEKMAHPETYRDAVELLQNKGYTVLPYLSQFIKSVDQTTYGRLLIFVPGDRFDRWIQFAIATPGMRPVEIESVSVVAVQKGRRSKVYFMDYLRRRDADRQIVLTPTSAEPKNPSSNCYGCHKSGVIPIHPLTEYDFDLRSRLKPAPTQVAETLNRRIPTYGASEIEGLDQPAYGPTLGPNLPRENLPERIKAAMSCAHCHANLAPLNFPQAVQTKGDLKAFKAQKGLVQTYIENGWMPPNNDLTPTERKLLWQTLLKEYFNPGQGKGLLIDWLKGG